jgi:hypothetical protein
MAAALTGEWLDSVIVFATVVATAGIGYSREYDAERSAAALRARLRVRATALRDGRPTSVAAEEVVPGDVVLLSAGMLVPADAVLLEAADLFVNEAVRRVGGRARRAGGPMCRARGSSSGVDAPCRIVRSKMRALQRSADGFTCSA